ncbi:MAG: hypothetical protein K8U57_16150 [Planctomycetes bacterium]|nr:hypothetical protein [Planctomycetota bacterium]
MRLILGSALVMALCGATLAGQAAKVDGKLLAGKWEQTPDKVDTKKDKEDKEKKAPPPAGPAMVIEFTPNEKMPLMGTMSVTVTDAGKDFKVDGKYTLAADKLTVEMKLGDKDVKETLTIKKLTDSEFVTEDSKQKTENLRRKR